VNAQPTTLEQKKREVFILRLWPKSPQGIWIIEIQNIKTGQVIHLSEIEAIAGYIRNELRLPTIPE
jgi:hypothetical protein